MRTLRQLAVILFVLLLFVAPWHASAAGARTVRFSPPNGAAPVSLLNLALEALARFWAKNGCDIDPSGRCAPAPTFVIQGDNGCRIDPNGRCSPSPVPTIQLENGCGADPNGRCGS